MMHYFVNSLITSKVGWHFTSCC